MKKEISIGLAVVALVIIAGFVAWKVSTPAVPTFKIDMVDGEQISSWQFAGAYVGNAELETKARDDIKRLQGLLGSGQFTDYTLYVSIANQYGLMGDGANELQYLEKALAIDSTKTGLAWHNVGQLFARLGAYKTARIAFERAVAVQPIPQYQQALADFIKEH